MVVVAVFATICRGCGENPPASFNFLFAGLALGPKFPILAAMWEALMAQFEYKVVPAPVRGEKVRGAKTTQDRFAQALMTVMNDLGRDGWEYLRADTLPCEERVGFTGRQTTFQHMLVFRRVVSAQDALSSATSGPALVASPTPDVTVPPAPRVDWPVNNGAPALGPARPVAAE
jgi:Domain of unknown function (DUF4177)